MGHHTQVILITGFLGSGKTTFLNRLLAAVPRSLRILVLVNEFGEIGVDGVLVEGDGYELMEISKGSIFCICVKRDFIKSLYSVATDLKPDLLLMEATGVANPADLKLDLRLPLFQGRFQLVEQICLVDASCFDEEYKVFASVEKQIATSSLFLLNKVDLAPPEKRERIKAILRAHHPDPRIVETVRGQMPVQALVDKLNISRETQAAATVGATEAPLPPGELDAVVSRFDGDPFREVTPPDRLVSAAYVWSGGGDERMRALVSDLPRGVVRGKGFYHDAQTPRLLNIVNGQAAYETVAGPVPPELAGRIVLIFPPELAPDMETLVERWSPSLTPVQTSAGCG